MHGPKERIVDHHEGVVYSPEKEHPVFCELDMQHAHHKHSHGVALQWFVCAQNEKYISWSLARD